MRCPRCNEDNDQVIDSRTIKEGISIRRRRMCKNCAARFTTYEQISEWRGPAIVDETGKRVDLLNAKDKIQQYIDDACANLSISQCERDHAADNVMLLVVVYEEDRVPADVLFGWIAGALGELHEVARVRFELSYMRPVDVVDSILIITKGMARDYARKTEMLRETITEIDGDISI